MYKVSHVLTLDHHDKGPQFAPVQIIYTQIRTEAEQTLFIEFIFSAITLAIQFRADITIIKASSANTHHIDRISK